MQNKIGQQEAHESIIQPYSVHQGSNEVSMSLNWLVRARVHGCMCVCVCGGAVYPTITPLRTCWITHTGSHLAPLQLPASVA